MVMLQEVPNLCVGNASESVKSKRQRGRLQYDSTSAYGWRFICIELGILSVATRLARERKERR
jgi:hypothetical protein